MWHITSDGDTFSSVEPSFRYISLPSGWPFPAAQKSIYLAFLI
jgi:hypothetical protein